jgi:glycosyltransferase involved in cell wall biosynthesis
MSVNARPKISIIIPTRDRQRELGKVLTALENQDCGPSSYEVVVVDDGSVDSIASRLREFASMSRASIRFFPTRNRSAGGARNLGIRHAHGEYILFLDADTIPSVDLVRRHLQLQHCFNGTPTCLVGRVRMSPELARPEQARMWETEWKSEIRDGGEISPWDYRTANTSMKRSHLLNIGGFDAALFPIEDTELAQRLCAGGMRFLYDDTLVATHYHPMTLEMFLVKGETSGVAVSLWYQKQPDLRAALALRYGVYAPEMPPFKKLKYLMRACVVNRCTVPAIQWCGVRVRRRWLALSQILYKCAFRYRLRRAFRTCSEVLRREEFERSVFSCPVLKGEPCGF